jgi:FtsZ-binding cell division protein ZapB
MNGMGMGFGMGGMGGMGMMNMGGLNMGGMGGMNPMAMGGMGGVNPMMMQQMNYGGAGMNAGPYGLNPVRGKVEELVSTAQFLVQQYDQIKRENDELQQGGASQQEVQSLQEQINVFRSKVAEIETQRSQWQVL